MLIKWDVHKSFPYNCKITSSNETVKQMMYEIWDTLDIDKIKKRDLKFDCVTTTLLNLKYSWDTSCYIRVPRKMSYYSEYPKRYKYPFFTYKIMVGVINGLVKLDKIEMLVGFKNYNDGSGQQTKIIPKDEFAAELKSIKRNMIEENKPPELVILKTRGDDKIMKDYKDTNKTKQIRKSLIDYNELRQSSTIDLRGVVLRDYDKDVVSKIKDFYNKFSSTENYNQNIITLRNPYIYRVFNNSFNLGGRFYGGIESNMTKVLRKKIFIDNEETVELDYSSMHIRMLYHKNKIDYRKNAYADASKGDDDLKKLYKLIGLVTINSSSTANAINGIRNEIRNKDLFKLLPNLKDETIKPFIDKWILVHPKISEYLNSDYGIKLQNIDSDIAQIIVDYFTKKGILALVVHDSFIVQKRYEDELKKMMKDVYYSKFSFNPVIN